MAAPFVLVQGDNPSVLGYYTLSASSISTADVAPEMNWLNRSLPNLSVPNQNSEVGPDRRPPSPESDFPFPTARPICPS